MPTLLCGRFENDYESSSMFEQFASIEKAGVRWDIDDFGVSRLEVTVNRSDSYSAYDSYKSHNGQRLALYTDWAYGVVTGIISETKWLTANQIQYIAKGGFAHMYGQYVRRFYDPSATVTDVINSMIDTYIQVDDGDKNNIYTNATTLNGWVPNQPQGEPPYTVIKDMLKQSTPDFTITDFWLKDNPMVAGNLSNYKAFYQPRTMGDITPDWVVYRRDLDQLTLSRSINDITTTSRVYYGAVTGTITANTATSVTDAAGQFITLGVLPGDRITDTTSGGTSTIVSVDSQTQLTIDGWKARTTGTATGGGLTTLDDSEVDFTTLGVANGDTLRNIDASAAAGSDVVGTVTGVAATQITCAGGMTLGIQNNSGERYEVTGGVSNGDSYLIQASSPNRFVEESITPEYIPIERSENYKNADAAQATQIAKTNVSQEPLSVLPFAIRSDFIRDGNGAKWPLWEVVTQGGGYIQIPDLYPTATTTLNSETTFFITALDYDHSSRQLRVNVDTLDRTLDARLKRALILPSKRVIRR